MDVETLSHWQPSKTKRCAANLSLSPVCLIVCVVANTNNVLQFVLKLCCEKGRIRKFHGVVSYLDAGT